MGVSSTTRTYLYRYYELLWESVGISRGGRGAARRVVESAAFVYNFTRCDFRGRDFTQRRKKNGKVKRKGSVREILLLFMYFDTQFARQFGAGNYGESLRFRVE